MPHANDDTDTDTTEGDDGDDTSPATVVATGPPGTTTTNGDGPIETTGVYTPYRRVVAVLGDGTEIPFDGVDLDVTVTHRDRGVPTWSVTAYDLAPRVWDHLRGDASIRITVGWRDGPKRTAVRGPVQLLRPQSSTGRRGGAAQRGPRYVMRGVSHDGARLGKRTAKTWQDATPTEIVRDIAHMANLDVGSVTAEMDTFDSHWTITSGRTLLDWVDKLADDVARKTGDEYTWYARSGSLYFVPRGTATGREVVLAHADATRRYPTRRNATTPRDSGAAMRSFSRALEPAVDRGRRVEVGQQNEAGEDTTTHVVAGYQFESSSTTGRHYVHGTLTPAGAAYDPDVTRSTDTPGVDPREPDAR